VDAILTPSATSTVIPTKLYVTNFPFTCTQRQIQELFAKFGPVVECTLKKDYYAYIQYATCRDAHAAFKSANGLRLLGRKLTVHLATSKKSQSHINHASAATNVLGEPCHPGKNERLFKRNLFSYI
jgi:RNA recognition motif-containing protein